jgi:GNAT superfamily N-acetyltransferase
LFEAPIGSALSTRVKSFDCSLHRKNNSAASIASYMIVRDPRDIDEADWRRLWSGYNSFYKARIPEAVTNSTWQRMLNPKSAIFGRLAIAETSVVGFTLSVLHEGTWTVDPICYLEDLFVDENYRGRGFGKLLVQDLVTLAKSRGWSRLYWHTQTANPARSLYDEFVAADDFVRYRLILSDH